MTHEIANVPHANPLAILEAAVNSGANVESIRELSEIAKQWKRLADEERFNAAMAAFQAELPQIGKGHAIRTNAGGYRYATLDDIMRAVGPVMGRHGISVSFSDPVMADGMLSGRITVSCGAVSRSSTISVPVPEMRVNDTQKWGAALSYARRYALCAALNITTGEDVDAVNLAPGSTPGTTERETKPRTTPPTRKDY